MEIFAVHAKIIIFVAIQITTMNNIFEGNSCKSQCARSAYKLLMTRQWVSYKLIIEDYLGKQITYSVSKCKEYGELKKAVPEVIKLITDKITQSIETRGNIRNREFRYVGNDNDPLKDLLNSIVIKDLQTYWQFCQNTAGFVPIVWLEHFFRNSHDLLDIKKRKSKGEERISTSFESKLRNIELLPKLYEAIENRHVLALEYEQYYSKTVSLIFHPHYLKEYNNRWFLFGHAEGLEPRIGYNVALDRISCEPILLENKTYIESPSGFYTDLFKDIVGVTNKKDSEIQTIRIRAFSPYIFNLIETKPIHSSQIVDLPYNGNYGDFLLRIKINNEFIGRILQMGQDLEVISPENIRLKIKERIECMSQRYIDNNLENQH